MSNGLVEDVSGLLNDINYLHFTPDTSTVLIYFEDGSVISDSYSHPHDARQAFLGMADFCKKDFVIFSDNFLFKCERIKKIVAVEETKPRQIILFFKHAFLLCEVEYFATIKSMKQRYTKLVKKINLVS